MQHRTLRPAPGTRPRTGPALLTGVAAALLVGAGGLTAPALATPADDEGGESGCVEPAEAGLSFVHAEGSATVTLERSLCAPLHLSGVSWNLDAPPAVFPQTWADAVRVSVQDAGEYTVTAPDTGAPCQQDIYASYDAADLDALGEGSVLQSPGQPYEPTFLHDIAPGEGGPTHWVSAEADCGTVEPGQPGEPTEEPSPEPTEEPTEEASTPPEVVPTEDATTPAAPPATDEPAPAGTTPAVDVPVDTAPTDDTEVLGVRATAPAATPVAAAEGELAYTGTSSGALGGVAAAMVLGGAAAVRYGRRYLPRH